MTGGPPAAVRLVRGWVRAYTRGLPADERERRRLELESDMWEHLHDPSEPAPHRALAGRFLRGIPADVRWRYRTLLDSRGARQRSHLMNSPRVRWWTPVTMTAGLAVGLLALLGLGFAETDAGGLVMVLTWFVASALILAGLAFLRRHPVPASWAVIAGAVVLASDPILIPVALVLVVGGFWTGNLVVSHGDGEPMRLETRQSDMTERWYAWLGTGAALGALGFLVLLVWPSVTPDNCTEANPCWEDTAAWATWILSWMSGLVTAAIGIILGGLRMLARHRTRLA